MIDSNSEALAATVEPVPEVVDVGVDGVELFRALFCERATGLVGLHWWVGLTTIIIDLMDIQIC